MVYIIYKIWALLRYHPNYNIFECFFKKYNWLLFFKKKLISEHVMFSEHVMMENPKSEEETLIKDIRNLFRQYRILRYIKKHFEYEVEASKSK